MYRHLIYAEQKLYVDVSVPDDDLFIILDWWQQFESQTQNSHLCLITSLTQIIV